MKPSRPASVYPKIEQSLTAPQQRVTAHIQTWAMGILLFLLAQLSHTGSVEKEIPEASAGSTGEKRSAELSLLREKVPLSGLLNSY